MLGFLLPIEKDFAMSLLKQIQLAKADLDHLGSCTRTRKTPEQLAELDNKFFDALDQLKISRQR